MMMMADLYVAFSYLNAAYRLTVNNPSTFILKPEGRNPKCHLKTKANPQNDCATEIPFHSSI